MVGRTSAVGFWLAGHLLAFLVGRWPEGLITCSAHLPRGRRFDHQGQPRRVTLLGRFAEAVVRAGGSKAMQARVSDAGRGQSPAGRAGDPAVAVADGG